MLATLTAVKTQQELRKDIFAMVWPVAVENVLQMLIGFINTAMVGRLGAATILAVGLSGRITHFVWIIFTAIGTGTTVLIARALGARDSEAIQKTAKQALLTTFALMGFVVLIVFFFARNFLVVLKATPEALPLGVAYLRYLSFSIPFQALFLVISAILRGSGDTRTPMLIAFVINIVNVALNAVLIFGRFGFPALGFRGPAVATIAGQAVGAAVGVWYLFGGNSTMDLKNNLSLSFDYPVIKKILGIGIPSSTEGLFWQLAAVVLVRLINEFGTVAGAAYQLGLQAEGISYMPAAGFAIAATALTGRSLGAEDPHLAHRYVKELVRWGIMLTALSTAALVFAPGFLMGILTDDRAVIAFGATYLMIMGLSQIPQQVSSTLGGALRGSGDTVTPAISATAGIWGVRVPFAFILSKYTGLGVTGIWWAINLDHFVRLSIVGSRYLKKLSVPDAEN